MPFLSSGQTRTGSPASTSGTALYASSGTPGGSQVIQGDVEITGSVLIDDGLTVNQGGGTTLTVGSGGTSVKNTLEVLGTADVVGTLTAKGSLIVQKPDAYMVLNTSGTGLAEIDAFVAGASAPLLLNGNSGGPVGVPSLTLGSLLSIPPVPVAVDYLPSPWGGPSGTLVIAGVRVMWGNTNFGLGAGGTLTFSPAFGASPCVTMTPQFVGSVVGYATIGAVTAGTASYILTTSGGTGFGTNAYWIAIGKA